MENKRWDRWEIQNKHEASEWENHAMEKCDKISEEFLAHYFEPRMCLKCFKVEMFSMLRTKEIRMNGDQYINTRKWCIGCGHFHMKETYGVGIKLYRRRLRIRG